ncbi:transcription factor IIIA-like isoform X1 [Anopheles aquasalis]|uniref:transcription factor IIIA-like isoform X1 n=1 Tax=Anopheles aquasalis TaxID=42839 RepID=UPI00215B73A2|nr:transcription factor IIIA-like isoform X1 [Anopheles aquasalis]XP_050099503.1 transcription factor IIIA-like isoform X1 [Anopheles aquasalis]XP_050099504.1 transcription factor IIIA-like isoform X1 [Anopheles aquasalis]
MVSPKKVKFAADIVPGRPTTKGEASDARVDMFSAREGLVRDGTVPVILSDDEDAEKVDVRTIMKGFCQDSAFYRSAKHHCDWIDCKFQTKQQQKFMMHVEGHATNIDRDEDGFVCKWQLCDFSTEIQDDFEGHLHYHAFLTTLKVFGARLRVTVSLPTCIFESDNLNKVPNDTNVECAWGDCRMQFNKIMEFGLHLDSHYSDLFANHPRGKNKKLRCQWLGCTNTIRSLSKAKVHGQKHTGPRYIACDKCGHTFNVRHLFVKHLLATTVPDPKGTIYKCYEIDCDKEFTRKHAYELHLFRHSFVIWKPYKCSICTKSYERKYWFTKHVAKHRDSMNKSNEKTSNVARNVTRRKSYCEGDNIDEQTIGARKIRMRRKSVGEVMISSNDKPAEVAPKRTKEGTHSSPRKRTCETPERQEIGSGKGAYEIHSRSHQNPTTKNYDCSMCIKSYTSKTWYLKHLSIIHNVSMDNSEDSTSNVARNVTRRKSYCEGDNSDKQTIGARKLEKRRKSVGEVVSSSNVKLAGDAPKQSPISLKPESKEGKHFSPRKRTCKTPEAPEFGPKKKAKPS